MAGVSIQNVVRDKLWRRTSDTKATLKIHEPFRTAEYSRCTELSRCLVTVEVSRESYRRANSLNGRQVY